ncbi:hypothetical protein AUC61_06405 [Pseudomonas sp. S25]|uniref:Uncharacterized protein n=1 Tax=Pseudomonas maioricensis TaxID=1766623 RepID=A0ABS9ZHY4_9PSED|nr:hypothetical protein [Pseudomonas sp. S25]
MLARDAVDEIYSEPLPSAVSEKSQECSNPPVIGRQSQTHSAGMMRGFFRPAQNPRAASAVCALLF